LDSLLHSSGLKEEDEVDQDPNNESIDNTIQTFSSDDIVPSSPLCVENVDISILPPMEELTDGITETSSEENDRTDDLQVQQQQQTSQQTDFYQKQTVSQRIKAIRAKYQGSSCLRNIFAIKHNTRKWPYPQVSTNK